LFFWLFREAFKTCCHLMLNSSWDASQWCNIRKFEKYYITALAVCSHRLGFRV
jgi:hypothetical protein